MSKSNEEFMLRKEAMEFMNMTGKQFMNLSRAVNLFYLDKRTPRNSFDKYCLKKIKKYKAMSQEWNCEHIARKIVIEDIGLNFLAKIIRDYNIKSIDIPVYARNTENYIYSIFYCRKDIDTALRLLKDKELKTMHSEEFMLREQAIEFMMMTNYQFILFSGEHDIVVDGLGFVSGQRIFYSKKKLMLFKQMGEDWHTNHISRRKALEELSISPYKLKEIVEKYGVTIIDVPSFARNLDNKLDKDFYSRMELIAGIEQENKLYECEFNKDEFVFREEAMNIMDMTNVEFRNFSQEYDVFYKGVNLNNNKRAYSIEALKKYKVAADEWRDKHFSTKEAILQLGAERNLLFLIGNTNLEQIEIPSYARDKQNKLERKYYNKEDLIKVAHSEHMAMKLDIESKQMISIKECMLDLNLLPKFFDKKIIVENKKIEKYNFVGESYISYSDMIFIKACQQYFLDNHMYPNKAKELIGEKGIKSLRKIMTPDYIKYKDAITMIMYKTEDVITRLNNIESEYDSSELISATKSAEVLNLDIRKFGKALSEYNISPVRCVNNKRLFLIKDIELLQEQQKHLRAKYFMIGDKEIPKSVLDKCKRMETPILLKYKDKVRLVVYDVYEVMNQYDEYTKIQQLKSIEGKTPYETFEFRVSFIDSENIFNNDSYTKKKWYGYVYNKLATCGGSKANMDRLCNILISCTEDLIFLMKNYSLKEVYYLTTPQIELFLKTINSGKKRKHIYKFLFQVQDDIKLKAKETSMKAERIAFDMSEISLEKYKNNSAEIPEETNDEIYSYKEYKLIFDYVNKTNFHIKNSIEKIVKRNDARYASVWLYILLHLNNAWRLEDFSNFPKLNIEHVIEELKIDDLSWFEDNSISLDSAKEIIARVRNYEIKISKNKMEGHFFCSDDLAISFASVVIILHLYNKNYSMLNTSIGENLMDFKTKYNTPTSNQINNFFKEMNKPDLTFESRKMNKTLMTFIHLLATQNREGDKAIMYTKYMRSHKEKQSSTHYIILNQSQIDDLTKQLFQRGEFSYIVDTLIDIINGATNNRFETTNRIQQISKEFGNYLKVEHTVGLLNHFNKGKESVVELLRNKSIEECQLILNDIYMGKLPAADKNIQCLCHNEGCKQPLLDTCFQCQYHIPSIYALYSLTEELYKKMKDYASEEIIGKKLKLSVLINHYISVFAEAIDKFGKDFIYNLMTISREDFLNLFESIDEPEDNQSNFKK